KPGGVLVYATCTLYPQENEWAIASFLSRHPSWRVEVPNLDLPVEPTKEGWLKIWPHRHQMDGFFIAKLRH
ncbi:MAG: 16S rRNA (cytosine(967)-C(5))-methyltransferase, partial [Arthrospira sp. SH-MAG29]|nr:16S rRNA (cytosine(967)-C(5))-methyltransferase [Arthrospira sp. SH-MAG29]